MTIPLPDATNPILYHERKVWVKGFATGLVQDVNVASWIGSTAPTVGQKTMAASLPVVIASDQSAVPVTIPPNLTLVANLGLTTSAIVNAVTQGVAIAAPGAGLFLRIWWAFISTNQTAQGPLNWQLDLRDNPFTLAFGRVAHAGFNDSQLYWASGFRLPVVNTGVVWTIQSSLASLQLGLTIGYTIE